MTFINQALLAEDTTFRLMVRLALVEAAVQIQGEAKASLSDAVYGKREALAGAVLADSSIYVDRAAWAVAQNSAITRSAPVSITSSTAANPSVLTTATHSLTSGDTVVISDHATNTAANGTWVVTVLSSTTFSIPTLGTGSGTGGTVRKYPPDGDIAFQVASIWNDLASVTGVE